MINFIGKWLHIYPSERKAFLRIALLFFFVYFFLGLFRVYVEASFLKRYGPGNIPFMLVLNGVLSFFFFYLCRRLGNRFSDGIILAGFLLLFRLIQGGLYWGTGLGIDITCPVLFQILYLKDAFLLVYLWNIPQTDFDARQGKRLFRLFMAAQVLGSTMGSLIVHPLAHTLGMDAILGLCAAAEFILSIIVVLARFGRTAQGRQLNSGNVTIESTGVFKAIGRYPIFRFLCVCALIPNILLPILTYQFGVLAGGSFHSEHDLMVFLSWFRGGTTLFVFLFILSIGRLYARIPTRTAAIITPLNQCLVFGGIAGFFNIFSAAYGQLSAILFQRAILGPITKQLCALLPEDIINWAQTYVRGTLSQGGMLVGALLMLILKPTVSPREMAIVALVLAIFWSIEAFFFRRRYREGLKQIIAYECLDYDQFSELARGRFDNGISRMPTIDLENYPEEILTLMDKLDIPSIEPDEALRLLESSDEQVRAEAALSFALSRDFRAVNRLIGLLEDVDSVRRSAIVALSQFGSDAIPIFEESLIASSVDVQRQLLEILRLTKWPGLDARPFLGKIIMNIYDDLIAASVVKTVPGIASVAPLQRHLEERIQEKLNLVFLTLWITYADMRLAYWGINSMKASVAVELLETSLDATVSSWLIPLIDSLPEEERINRGRRLFPLMQKDSPDHIIAILCRDEDPLTRLLALCVIGQLFAAEHFYPLAERRLGDSDPTVRQAASYCMKRCLHQEVAMPPIIQLVQTLSGFDLFKGLGIRELRAVASITLEMDFPSGSIIVESKKPLGGLYLVNAGLVARRDSHGHQVDLIAMGTSFGAIGLFAHPEALHEYVALEDTSLLMVRTEHFIEIIKLYPQVGLNLCRYFADKLLEAGLLSL
ncbi:MAG: cyclic nucleotide-binding domain-containing protein [Deltaproteobacteria bacterium]